MQATFGDNAPLSIVSVISVPTFKTEDPKSPYLMALASAVPALSSNPALRDVQPVELAPALNEVVVPSDAPQVAAVREVAFGEALTPVAVSAPLPPGKRSR
jgi:hypothetical protein